MHPSRHSDPSAPRLQPAGRRWGFGAHSVVPYLVHSLPPSGSPDAAIRNPVFPHMERTLRALPQKH